MEDEFELHLPPPPEEPAPEDCCNNDCCPCVRDIYEQALQRHRTTVRLLKMRQQIKMKIGPHCSISIHVVDDPALQSPVCTTTTTASFASILGAAVLTEQARARGLDVRQVMLLELGLGSSHAYEPGDYLVVRPHNDAHIVHALLRRLRAKGEQVVVVGPAGSGQGADDSGPAPMPDEAEARHQHFLVGEPPCTLAHILMHKCDISAPPSKAMLHALAQFTFDEEEKEELLYLCGAAQWQREFYQRNILHQRPGLLEVLERYPSCRPPLEHVLEHIPPQRERYYSIASSPLLCPSSVHVVFPVVEYVTPAPHRRLRRGLCTSWLRSLAIDHHHRRHRRSVGDGGVSTDDCTQRERGDDEDRDASGAGSDRMALLEVWIKRATDFKLPSDPTLPLILVCAGSGIAPFRGFLQHRRAMRERTGSALGECWLFVGFRYLDGDFLFREELEAMQREGVLTRLIPAASREAIGSCKVQDRIVEHGRDVHRLLVDHKAVLYVCGDAQGMAAGVHEALAQVIAEHGRASSEEDPHAVLARLQRERRYLRDVWSARKTTV